MWISYKHTCISSLLRLPPSHLPTPPHKVVREHQAELSELCSSFLLAIYFTNDSLYMSRLLSQFILPSLLPPLRPQACSLHLQKSTVSGIILHSAYMIPLPAHWPMKAYHNASCFLPPLTTYLRVTSMSVQMNQPYSSPKCTVFNHKRVTWLV